MVVSLKANRKRILAFILLAAIVAGACFFLTGRGEEEARQPIPGGTNEGARGLFGELWLAGAGRAHRDPGGHDSRPVQRCVHRLQRHAAGQGFDLEPYAGQICTQYVYKVENHPGDDQVYATLLVYGDEIIGGDIASTAVDGFMHGFASDSAHFGKAASPPPRRRQPPRPKPRWRRRAAPLKARWDPPRKAPPRRRPRAPKPPGSPSQRLPTRGLKAVLLSYRIVIEKKGRGTMGNAG